MFEVDPPSVQGDDPVILTAELIRNSEVHLLPAGRSIPSRRVDLANISLHPAFGGYGILKKIVDSKPEGYYSTLWAKSAEVPVWIGSCDFSDPFEDLMQSFSVTKFGGVRVTKDNEEALATLGDAIGLIREGKLSTNMSTDDVSSVPVAISKDASILEAIRTMVSHNIRRLFVEKGQGSFISDRTVIDYMFSPARLGVARDHPELWIDDSVDEVGTKDPGSSRTGPLDDAAGAIGPAPDDCLMTDDHMVVTRLDIVVKPWRSGKLESAEY